MVSLSFYAVEEFSSCLDAMLFRGDIVVLSVTMALSLANSSSGCVSERDCGWHGVCLDDGTCTCLPGYSREGDHCIDDLCGDSRCLECWDSRQCSKCIDFVEEGTGRCLNKCPGTYSFLVEGARIGRVCKAEEGMIWTTTYTVIAVSCAVGVLLLFVILLLCCLKIKSNSDRKKRILMHSKQMEQLRREKEQRQVSQQLRPYSGLDDSVNGLRLWSPSDTLEKRRRLQKHVDVLTHMYLQSKRQIHNAAGNTPRCLDLRNMTHHLGRVLVLLRAQDNSRLPDDAPVLFDLAERLLVDFFQNKQSRSAPVSRCVTPGNTLQRLTSTFRPEPQFTSSLPGTSQPSRRAHNLGNGDISPSTTTLSFTYDRNQGTTPQLSEISMIELQDQHNWTESVIV